MSYIIKIKRSFNTDRLLNSTRDSITIFENKQGIISIQTATHQDSPNEIKLLSVNKNSDNVTTITALQTDIVINSTNLLQEGETIMIEKDTVDICIEDKNLTLFIL